MLEQYSTAKVLLRSENQPDDSCMSFMKRLAASTWAKETLQLPLQINYSNKNMLLGAMIVGGWDPERGGQIYGVPIGGTLVEQAWTTDGSGSTYIWGYLDAAYRYPQHSFVL